MTALWAAAWLLAGYLPGSIPFGLLLTRAAGLGDIRAIGSGNIGATNVLRTGNRKLAAATLLLDGIKGAAAVGIGWWLGGPLAGSLAGFGAVAGHLFPIWLRFRGGKGVATGFGVLIASSWPAGLAAGAIWIAVFKRTKISSAGALAAYACAPILAWLLAGPRVAALALAIAILIIGRHHTNIKRLINGTEPKVGQTGSKEGQGSALNPLKAEP